MKKLFSKKLYLFLTALLFFVLLLCTLSACGKDSLILRASKDATTYSINAIYNDDTKMLYGTQSVKYINDTGEDLTTLQLHLYPNAFREDATYKPVSQANEEKAYPNGFSPGSIEIKNVKVGGKAVSFEIGGVDKNILIIPLTNSLQPKSTVEFSLEFDEVIPNVRHRFGYTDKSVNLGNWYPIMCVYENGKYQTEPYSYNGDPFYSDIGNYIVEFTVDEKFVVAHTGELTKSTLQSGKKNYSICARAVRDFALSLSNLFNYKTCKEGKTTINYYYYGDKNPEKSLETSAKAVRTFNELYGDYPYSTLNVVETGFLHGGMEYPGIVYISDDIENYDDYSMVIIHEIAHQWWYGVVGDNEVVDAWIDEGLAEYSTALFYANNSEYGKDKSIIYRDTLNSYLLFLDVYNDIFGKVDTSMTRKLTEYSTEPEYTYMAYVKSVLMFHTLEDLVGTKKFISSLKYIYSKYAMKNITKEQFIESFEANCNIPLEQFFDSWLNGKIIIQSP